MDARETVTSPRLISLLKDLAGDRLNALDNFWQEISIRGAPLVEPIPGNERDLLVTFLYRSTKDDARIGLVSDLSGRMGDYEAMTLLPGTDVWFISHRLPEDTRETYQLSIDGQDYLDPFNPEKEVFPVDEDTGFGGWESSVFELPAAPVQAWSSPRPGVATGQASKYYLASQILGHEYPVWIYTPPGYSPV